MLEDKLLNRGLNDKRGNYVLHVVDEEVGDAKDHDVEHVNVVVSRNHHEDTNVVRSSCCIGSNGCVCMYVVVAVFRRMLSSEVLFP